MADDAREALLVANRLSELAETPIKGAFDLAHLRAIHAHVFQDLPHHQPGEVRSDTPNWSKTRLLDGHSSGYDVHYAHEYVSSRVGSILEKLEPTSILQTLPTDVLASRIARLYGDLDHAHSFYEGNSRTLREFTRELALETGYKLDWTPTGVSPAQRNRLYIARDIAVLERAYPGLTPERGLTTNDRYEYEASLTLAALRRSGANLESIVREGLTPAPAAQVTAARQAEVPGRLGEARSTNKDPDPLSTILRGMRPSSDAQPPPWEPDPTPMADRLRRYEARLTATQAEPVIAPVTATPDAAPQVEGKPTPGPSPSP